MKHNPNKLSLDQVDVQIDPNIKDHSNDPFVIRKGKASLKRIKKYGFPEDLLKLQAVKQSKLEF